MQNTSRDFGLFIENIRVSRKILQEDFVDGILSKRQYQRYLKGESAISNEKMIKLVDKLELEFFSVYNRYLKSSDIEHKMVNELYNFIISLEFKKSFELVKEYKDYKFETTYYMKLFELYSALIKHKLKRISNSMAISIFEKSIGYPKTLKNDTLNFIELTALLYISQITKDHDELKTISTKLYHVLKYNKLSDFDNKDGRLATVYSTLSKVFGFQQEYDKVIFLANKGIEICEHHRTFISLSHLYYYSALAYLRLNKDELALNFARKAFFTLEIENNPIKYKSFISIFEKQFKVGFEQFKTW